MFCVIGGVCGFTRARASCVGGASGFMRARASWQWCLRFRLGLGVGRSGETGGAFVGCVGGLVVTGGAFVGGFWAQMRCFALAVVPVVSCGAEHALSVVLVVSIGSVDAAAVASPVSCGRARAVTLVPVVSFGAACWLVG